jgi:hypothetical protein
MPKNNKGNKASAPAEGARTVEGKNLPETTTVIEAGNPDPTPANQVAVIEAPMALTFPETMTEVEYFAFGRKMGEALQGASWRVGDYANFGKAKFGIKDYTRLADETGLDEVYIRQCSSIAERVSADYRALASLERFRLLLPKREKIVKDGKTAGMEEIPALVERYADWTAREIRAGAKDKPKELGDASAADTGSAGRDNEAAANAEAGQAQSVESEPGDAALKAATAVKVDGEMTATAIYEMARKLQIGIEILSADRLATLAVMEQKFAVIKPLSALTRILVTQIHTELNK